MNIDINISIEPNHVYLRCAGPYSLTGAKRVFQTAVEVASESDRSRVLIDAFGITGHIPTLDRFQIAVFLTECTATQSLVRLSRIAVVGDEPLIDPDRFGETVAVNRGINAKAMKSLDEGVEWLNQ